MSRLKQLQTDFFAAIADQSLNHIIAHTASPDAGERLNIYHNNIYGSLIEALKITFPVVFELVGENYFQQVAKAYIQDNWPTQGALLYYGDAFPTFLKQAPGLEEKTYISEVALLEWLRHQVYYASMSHPFDVMQLTAMDEEQLGQSILYLRSNVVYHQFATPAHTLWEAHQCDDAAKRDQMLNALNIDQAQHVLIYRSQDLKVRMRIIDGEGEQAFWQGIMEQKPIGAIADSQFEQYLTFCLQHDLIEKVDI